jgi:hypothetical protein
MLWNLNSPHSKCRYQYMYRKRNKLKKGNKIEYSWDLQIYMCNQTEARLNGGHKYEQSAIFTSNGGEWIATSEAIFLYLTSNIVWNPVYYILVLTPHTFSLFQEPERPHHEKMINSRSKGCLKLQSFSIFLTWRHD